MNTPSLFRRFALGGLLVLAASLLYLWHSADQHPRQPSPAVRSTSLDRRAALDRAARAEDAAGTRAENSSASPAAPARASVALGTKLWGDLRDPQGTKLPADPSALEALRRDGHGLVGRSAQLDASSLAILADLRPGDAVTLPLFSGEAVAGRVNLVQAEAGNWIRVGGVLTGGRRGTFALDGNGDRVDGMVLLTDESLAVLIATQADGSVALQEKPLGEVLCTPMPLPVGAEHANDTGGSDEVPSAITIPLLDSRPTATAVVYLDFDGETVTDPKWAGGATIVAAPANVSASDVTQVWNSVKEDYWPFNITITTDRARYNAAPVNRRTRVIITPTDTAAPGSGGVAYVGSFVRAGTIFSSTIPCWVFVPGPKPIAEAVSHEVGHTLGLNHDGRTNPVEEYYAGHGSGAVGWAPIMGVGYYRELVQWSKGEYPNPSNTEDDIAIISTQNGFGFIPDDAGNTIATAATLNVVGNAISQTGIISNANDLDFYRVTVGVASTLSVNASPAAVSPNVDILIELQDAGGNVLASGNPDLALDASLTAGVPAGTYYIKVRGTGRGSVSADGYSNYGCAGAYTLSGAISGAAQAPTISGLADIGATAGVLTSPMSFTVADADTNVNALTLSATSSNSTLVPVANIAFGGAGAARTITLLPASGQTGTSTITVTVSDGALTGSGSFVVTVSAPTSIPVFTTSPASQTVTVGGSVTFNSAANGLPAPTYQWAKNGNAIVGATNPSFTINPVALTDAGSYTVTASNSVGNATSVAATLTVNSGGGGPVLLTGTPIGSAPWHGLATGDKFAAFDGNTATAFDSEAGFIFVGLDFATAKSISRIRYFPRATLAFRMNGGRFRGANSPDLSDAVTIYTIPSAPPEGVWQDVTLPSPSANYRYIFYTTDASGYGNVAEIEFYGDGTPPPPPPPPTPPAITGQPQNLTVAEGNPAAFAVTTDAAGATYQWFKDSVSIGGAIGSNFAIGATALGDAGSYTVFVTAAGLSTTSNAATLTVLPHGVVGKLPGYPIGSAPWHGLAAGDKFAAFDGDTATAFDSEAGFIFVGLDFATTRSISRIRYFPRATLAFRMNGGRFCGANADDLSDAVTIYTIPSAPPEGVWQDVTLPSPSASYRYVFFTTGAAGYGNVAEIEFYGTSGVAPAPHITGQPTSLTVNEGMSAAFSVGVDISAVTYQWFKNGNAIFGAAGATYSIPVTLAADAGSYTVTVTSLQGGGSATSNAATLTVVPVVGSALLTGTPIGSAPWHGLAAGDKSAAFDGNTATAFDSEAAFIYVGLDLGAAKTLTRFRYFPRATLAFRMNGGRICGANSPDLSDAVTLYTIPSAPLEGTWQDVTLASPSGSYRYVFYTTGASGYGNVAELEFYGFAGGGAPLLALNQVQSETVRAGESLTLSAGAEPGRGATWQWFKDGVAIPGATNATYQIAVVLEEDAGVYTVKVTEPSGQVSTHIAFIMVEPIAAP